MLTAPTSTTEGILSTTGMSVHTATMTPEEEIKQALDSISPDVSAFIAGAVELEGEELAEYVRLVAQMAYDEGRRLK
ncbi:hypothetical protein Q5Y75_27460 [Ruegeria sp. 2205SS24-7]|uniref:hypothetical protein n=1 Tax=Ruegeria discodermiae TaxID=3064389 RepID=UPI00274197EF|nr:hypothetical protein [Ruegeria sp. 2205SS24-7]MDP5220928.1 hypothetical protein [Ruegeria sp. 2205SS24-7]